jgi:hypothetical protein
MGTELYGLFLPPLTPQQAHIQEKVLIQGTMMAADAISLPARVLSCAFEKFMETPSVNPSQEMMREQGRTLAKDLGKLAASITPEPVKDEILALWKTASAKLTSLKSTLQEEWYRNYGIPREDTAYFFDSVGHNLSYLGVWGTSKLASRISKAVSSARVNFAESYFEDAREFCRFREFEGRLKKDLVIVRYHTENAYVSKSWKWWTSTNVANKTDTLSKVKDRLALLDAFGGEKTHVTVARIPRGTQIQLLHGRAKPQFSPGDLRVGTLPEFRPGGGYQIRVKDFDETWIQKSCSLSDPSICFSPLRQRVSPLNPFPSIVTAFPHRTSLHNPLVQGAKTIIDLAGDITGVNPACKEIMQLTNFVKKVLKDPINGPRKVVDALISAPERKLQQLLDAPNSLLKSGEAFLSNPAAGAFGMVTGVLAIVSIVHELKPILKLPQEIVKNPIEAPFKITKALVDLQLKSIKSIVELGISLIRDPIKTAVHLVQSVIRAPISVCEKVIDVVGSLFGRKKNKEVREIVPIPIQPSNIDLKILGEQIAVSVIFCFKVGKERWFILPDKSLNDYLSDLIMDWRAARSTQLCQVDFLRFPGIIQQELERENFAAVRTLSPRAHASETIPPISVVLASKKVAISTVELSIASNRLNAANKADKTADKQLSTSTTELGTLNKQLGSLMDSEEKRKALRDKFKGKLQNL